MKNKNVLQLVVGKVFGVKVLNTTKNVTPGKSHVYLAIFIIQQHKADIENIIYNLNNVEINNILILTLLKYSDQC